jgi:hypothetical protein
MIALPVLLQLDQCSDGAMQALHPAWHVLLEHMIVTDPSPWGWTERQQLVCRLSCVSRGMRSTVLDQAAGHVSVTLFNRLQQPRQQTLNSFAR